MLERECYEAKLEPLDHTRPGRTRDMEQVLCLSPPLIEQAMESFRESQARSLKNPDLEEVWKRAQAALEEIDVVERVCGSHADHVAMMARLDEKYTPCGPCCFDNLRRLAKDVVLALEHWDGRGDDD